MQTSSKRIKYVNKFQANYDASKKNPLCIPEIADHVFKFLKLSDIKNCRSVCQKWNQLALNFINKLSAVNILNPKSFEKFNVMFPIAEQTQIFTSFQFGHKRDGFGIEWPVYQFSDFSEKWHNNLHELTLVGPNFGLGKEDLSPFLPSTLTKLKIQCFNNTTFVSIDKICNIRILELQHCILEVMPGTTLNAVEIDLENITFREEGKENIEEFLINPLLNFDVLKKARFSFGNIMLDMQGSHSLDMLILQEGVNVINWETSNWEIKKLCFRVNSQFEIVQDDLSKSQIKYKELEIALAHLNVSLLPDGIEKLEVNLGYLYQKNPPRIYGEHSFPDLKHLHITLRKGTDFSPLLTVFKHCPKLTTLTVSIPTFDPCSLGGVILKTSSIPPSVNTLRVIHTVRIIVDQSLQLESLILHDPHHGESGERHNVVVELAEELNVKNLYWFEHDLVKNFNGYRNKHDSQKRNIFKSLIDLKLDNFVMGDLFPVSIREFQWSGLYPFVDSQGDCYLFQRGEKGKAISDCVAKHL